MSHNPIITGLGLVSPLGRTAPATFDALLAGGGITSHTRLEAPPPRLISIATAAANEAIAQASWNDQPDIAVVACTSKGSIEDWITSFVTRASGPGQVDSDFEEPHDPQPRARGPCDVDAFGLSDLSAHLANHIGSTGPRWCISAACASGLHGLIRGAMLIQSGEAKRVLVTAAEASVHPLFLASFKRLGVLPPAGEVCRPFDRNRSGFLMSEAAAAICLEADENQPRLAHVDRFAIAGDAEHLTAADPTARVLKHLLRSVIHDEPIDLFHAHGTATVLNDASELTAIEETLDSAGPCRPGLGRQAPVLYSHKAALGHSLGASGLMAVVINCLCHQRGVVPGNINTIEALPTSQVECSRELINRRIQRSVIHAAGFGGSTAVVSLKSN